jgi:bifunctional hydroxylase/dehydrase
MHGARAVLLDLRDDSGLRAQAAGWRDRVDVISARCSGGAPADALLIRPDGYVAWAGASAPGLERSLRRWFGSPAA